jgi:flagellar protein FlaF
MTTNPLDAYHDVQRNTLSGRALEAMALNKASMRLQEVKRMWGGNNQPDILEEVLRYNQRLWTYFQVELVDSNNPLPLELKNNLLALSAIVDRRTFDILADPSPEKLDLLITINQNVTAGLNSGGG